MNIDLEALHLNPLNYCDLMLRTATIVLFVARSRVSCTYLFLFTLDLVSATLRHFYLTSMFHTYSPPSFPPLRTIYLMGSFSSRIFTRTGLYLSLSSLDGLYSLDVSHRLVHSYRCTYMLCCHLFHGYPHLCKPALWPACRTPESQITNATSLREFMPLSNERFSLLQKTKT